MKDFENAFKEVDFIISPTTPTTAFKIGEKVEDPLSMYLNDIYTVSVNLAGIPAISIPVGFDKDKLPFGIQIMGKNLMKQDCLRCGMRFKLLIYDLCVSVLCVKIFYKKKSSLQTKFKLSSFILFTFNFDWLECASRICLTIESPSPLPPISRERVLSTL